MTKKKGIVLGIIIAVAVISALAVSLVLTLGGKARDREVFSYGKFDYIILDNGNIEIALYRGDEKSVTVPDVIKSRIVSSIGEGAFRTKNVTDVTLGSFITEIGDYAFSGCRSLKSISFDAKIESIGKYAFLDCNALSDFRFPDSLKKIGEGSDEIPEAIRQGHIAYVINTRDIGSNGNMSDGFEIRSLATENNVTIFTALDTVRVLLDVLEETTLCISTIDA